MEYDFFIKSEMLKKHVRQVGGSAAAQQRKIT